MHIHMCTSMYVHPYVYIHVCTSMCAHPYVYIHVCTSICYIYICRSMCVFEPKPIYYSYSQSCRSLLHAQDTSDALCGGVQADVALRANEKGERSVSDGTSPVGRACGECEGKKDCSIIERRRRNIAQEPAKTNRCRQHDAQESDTSLRGGLCPGLDQSLEEPPTGRCVLQDWRRLRCCNLSQ